MLGWSHFPISSVFLYLLVCSYKACSCTKQFMQRVLILEIFARSLNLWSWQTFTNSTYHNMIIAELSTKLNLNSANQFQNQAIQA